MTGVDRSRHHSQDQVGLLRSAVVLLRWGAKGSPEKGRTMIVVVDERLGLLMFKIFFAKMLEWQTRGLIGRTVIQQTPKTRGWLPVLVVGMNSNAADLFFDTFR